MDKETVERYMELIRFFERTSGYGEYVVILHGKQPVKVKRVSSAEKLPLPEKWTMRMINDGQIE
jgi:hypothetical protein